MRNNQFDDDNIMRDTLTKLALALGEGWRWAGNFEGGNPNRSIIREDGAGIVCHAKWNKDPGVLSFHVIWPRNPNGGEIMRPREVYGTNAETWEIHCNLTKRGFDAVAKDLHRRLLIRYLPLYEKQLGNLKEWEAAYNRRDTLAEEMAAQMNVMLRRDRDNRNTAPSMSIPYDIYPGLRDYKVTFHSDDRINLSAQITDPQLLASIWATIRYYLDERQDEKANTGT